MLTRCPHCETDFRVTPEQLKARQGQVRCGACRGVFNAIDNLADELLVPMKFPANLPTRTEANDPEVVPDVLPAWIPAEFPHETGLPDTTTTAEAVEAATVETSIPPDQPAQPAAESGSDAAIASLPADETASVAEETKLSPQEEPAETGDESRRWQDGVPRMGYGTDAESAPRGDPAAQSKATGMLAPAAWGPYVETPRPRRWPWVIGVVLMLLLAGGQMLYLFRVELAVLAPELRPTLLAACEQLGCTLPHPHKAELIGIESSDLAPAGTTGVAGVALLQLAATLKNRAPFVQEYPHLELTLTDTQDRALLRKVLTPADYLPADRAAASGFAANADVAVRLTFDSAGTPAVGYRLYLFYP
ncbi:MAG: DUF3426 domain-containing protein [Rhodocyclaceae bacterium]|jgi:predicted Zn finger-like uncharacterized protein|nr:DUF3426 domain-containing protein [Rhodocyclaceae bacterium]